MRCKECGDIKFTDHCANARTIDAVSPAPDQSPKFNGGSELCRPADARGQAAKGRKGLETAPARIGSANGVVSGGEAEPIVAAFEHEAEARVGDRYIGDGQPCSGESAIEELTAPSIGSADGGIHEHTQSRLGTGR